MNRKIMEMLNRTEMDQKKFICFGLKIGILIALIVAIIWDLLSNYKVVLFLLTALKIKIFKVNFLMAGLSIIMGVIGLFMAALILEGLFGPIFGSKKEKF